MSEAPDDCSDRTSQRDQTVPHPGRRDLHRPARPEPRGRARRILCRRRPYGLRQVDHPVADLGPGTGQWGRGTGQRRAGYRDRAGDRVHVPDRRRLPVEVGPRQRRRRSAVPRGTQAAGPRQRPRLAAPGDPVRVRRPAPAPALRRDAQAGRTRAESDQRAADPADGRAVLRPRRADPVDHVRRTARPVGAQPPDRRVHHPRPGGGDRARRQGRGDDRRPGDDQGDVPRRAAPAAQGTGDPVRPEVRRALPPHLGVAARRGAARLRPYHHRRLEGISPMSQLAASAVTAPAKAETVLVADPRARARARRQTIIVRVLQLAVFVVFVGGWELLSQLKVLDPFFFGQPSKIAVQMGDWLNNGTEAGSIWTQVGVTMEEALLGFAIGVVAGIVCGIALGRVPMLSKIFGPYIKVMNSIPRIVLGSIFIVWLGLGLSSKVALAIVLVFFAVFFNAYQGTREVDRNLVANARILGASGRQVTTQVVLPSALTWIIASLHVSFGFALIGAIVGEFLGAQKGLGLLIRQAQDTFNPNAVFAAMVIIAVVALVAEGLIALLERVLLSWRPPQLSGTEL